MEAGAIWANLVVATNGATTLTGRSKGLSFPEDREQFHSLRSQAKAILIGGATFRTEPYKSSPLPLYIATRHGNRARRQYSVSPQELVEIASREVGSPLLIEGGVNFLKPLLVESIVDTFFLTRSKVLGDGDFFAETLLARYQRIASTEFNAGVLERWQPRR